MKLNRHYLFCFVLLALTACGNALPTNAPPTAAPPATNVRPATAAPQITGAPPPTAAPPVTLAPNSGTTSGVVKIAFLLATLQEERYLKDKKFFSDAAQAMTATVIFNSADNEDAKQAAQVEDALAQGAQVLVIQPTDSDAAVPLIEAAHKVGAKVVAYDRLINSPDLDLYITHDSEKVGRLQAQAALDWLKDHKLNPPYNFVFLEGQAGHSVAAAITQGYYDVVDSLITQGDVRVIADQAHSAWSPDQALKTTQDALLKTNNNVQVILANNSGMARGALQALLDQKLIGRVPVFVAGADADLPNIKAICAGAQAMEVLKPIQPLAVAAATAAVRLARGVTGDAVRKDIAGVSALKTKIGIKEIPTLGVDVQAVTLETVQGVIIQSGFHNELEIGKCLPPLAEGSQVPTVSQNARLVVWIRNDEEEQVYDYLANLAAQFRDKNPGVGISIVSVDAENLRAHFQTAGRAGNAPDLLWMRNDQVRPLLLGDLIQAADNLIDPALFIEVANQAVLVNGKHYGVPLSYGNHLLLYYNKKLIREAPADTDALTALAPALTKADGSQYALVYNQTDPLWLVPWLGGFKGKVFGDDGKTPALNSPAMLDTLNFLKELNDKKVALPGLDANAADSFFQQGKAAMIINGDWRLEVYRQKLGADLGAARLPKISKSGELPHPYTSGNFLLFAKNLIGDKLQVALAFTRFVTSKAIQLDLLRRFRYLPALKEALADPAIAADPLLQAASDQMIAGTPAPTNPEMRCVWDSMRQNYPAVLSERLSAADAAKAMQESAEACIAKLR